MQNAHLTRVTCSCLTRLKGRKCLRLSYWRFQFLYIFLRRWDLCSLRQITTCRECGRVTLCLVLICFLIHPLSIFSDTVSSLKRKTLGKCPFALRDCSFSQRLRSQHSSYFPKKDLQLNRFLTKGSFTLGVTETVVRLGKWSLHKCAILETKRTRFYR